MIQLLDSSGDDSSLLVVVGQAQHRVGLTATSLSVAHHGPVVSLDDALHDLSGCDIVDIVLGSIVENVWELELPVVQSVVDRAHVFLVDLYFEVSIVGIDLEVVGCE